MAAADPARVMNRIALPPREQIEPNTPLLLTVAAALAFPDGSMSASGLRREAARGRLVIERIAGKDFTTLANIERMRELCRVVQGLQDSTFESGVEESPIGSSSTAVARSAQERAKQISEQLKKR